MFKKLLVTGATAGLLLVSAGGAFAWNPWHPAPLPTTNVGNNGSIYNTSVNVANTGLNLAGGRRSSVTTGNAVALQDTYNGIGTVSNCGCSTVGNTTVGNNGSVRNLSVNVANTGLNGAFHRGTVNTGGAMAGQDVFNVINTGVGSF